MRTLGVVLSARGVKQTLCRVLSARGVNRCVDAFSLRVAYHVSGKAVLLHLSRAELREAEGHAAADGLGLVEDGVRANVQHLVAAGLAPRGRGSIRLVVPKRLEQKKENRKSEEGTIREIK